jgi:hypothetical protein
MNDPSNTHTERAYSLHPITGSGGSARLARQMSSTFSYSWTGSRSRPVGLSQIKTRNEKEGRGALTALSLYLYFASRCPPVSQLMTLTTLLTLSPQLAINLSSIFRHLLIQVIIPIPAVLLVPGQGQWAQKIPRHPSTHNVQVYELIPT